ncbi:MAG: type II toxin-antitoxin system HicA family toxin [Chloroflexi bacterium]|nr:type II toxin-antitoxin system HicA family toxin [Chloroflexota bacterium]
MRDGGRRLRGLSGDRVATAFERLGYTRRKGKGGHVNLVRPGSPRLTIPLHRELGVGLILNEIKKAGVTMEEFLEALGR